MEGKKINIEYGDKDLKEILTGMLKEQYLNYLMKEKKC